MNRAAQIGVHGAGGADEVARHCQTAAYPRTFALRVTLAMLYALSDRTRPPYDAFWRECAAPDRTSDRNTARIMRSNAVRAAYHQICRTLGVQEKIDFCSDIYAAQHKEDAGTRFREANKRASQNAGAAARQRFAEMLRAGVREHDAVRERSG